MLIRSSWALAAFRRPASRLVIVVAVALLAGCQQREQPGPDLASTGSPVVAPNGLGRNGLGRNGLGRNGLGRNGLGRNGLGRNGLGRNGLSSAWLIDGAVNTEFAGWFEEDPVENGYAMGYFVRCAYDGSTEIQYVDASGTEWAWTGQYGLAMATLLAEQMMTDEERRWVSACLLAHVNMKGTHQYLSLRLPGGEPAPTAQAAAALATTPGERWALPFTFGQFFGDLYAEDPAGDPAPVLYACLDNPGNPYLKHVEGVLGRTCDTTNCAYLDEQGVEQPLLTQHLGLCGGALDATEGPWPHTEHYFQQSISVNGPYLAELEHAWWSGAGQEIQAIDVTTCSTGTTPWCTEAEAPFTVPIELSQRVNCLENECLGTGMDSGGPVGDSAKIVGLTQGQAIDAVLRDGVGRDIDAGEAFTAIVRYTKARTGAADVAIWRPDGTWQNLTHLSGYWDAPRPASPAGPDVWSFTGALDQFEWMQIYPVFPAVDPVSGKTALKIRIAGASEGTSCSGTKRFKGDGERGLCLKATLDKASKRFVCAKRFEVGLPCRGLLVWPQSKEAPGWRCVDGGAAVFACTGADAPDLDAAGFVPGRPWCAPPDATSFIGVCH